MKTFATLLLTLASALVASAAFAEPFNERGEDFIARVMPGSSIQYSMDSAAINSQGFNDRGENYIATVSSDKPRSEGYITKMGFNDRGDLVN